MLRIALQYWNGDREQALTLARRMADIEDKPRTDVDIEFVLRFDAKEPSKETLEYVGQKFKVSVYRCTRRGEGHPAGCDDVFHDYLGKCWERSLRDPKFVQTVDGVWFFEGDNVPLRKDWLDVMVAEWKEARQAGKLILGCWHPEGSPVGHINGNLIAVPDLFGRIKGLEGCPSQVAWDLYHAQKFEPHWFKSKNLANLYRQTNVPKKWLFDRAGKPKFANCHGVKDSSVYDMAKGLF